jgi:hypothetical protein
MFIILNLYILNCSKCEKSNLEKGSDFKSGEETKRRKRKPYGKNDPTKENQVKKLSLFGKLPLNGLAHAKRPRECNSAP